MVGPIFQKLGLAVRGGPGLACDSEGLALGPVMLAKRVCDGTGNRRYRLRPLDEIAEALCAAYGPMPASTLERYCRRIGRATELLGSGEDVLAGIHAVLIGLPVISSDGMAKLDRSVSLRKYNPDWEDEPRVPAGIPEGGEWTTDGGTGGSTDETSASAIDVAYNGLYHDQVVAELVAHWRSQGIKLVTSLALTARNGTTARADIVALDPSTEGLTLFQVKTGNDPQYTDPQRLVYPMAQVGDHVYSPDQKVRELGFAPGEWLPPMRVFTIYKYDERSSYRWIEHPNPILP